MARKKKNMSTAECAAPSIDKDWRARNDLDTLSRAMEIGRDSSRMKAAKAEAKKQSQSLARVARLSGKQI